MNQQEIIHHIFNIEKKIQLAQKKLVMHKNYFSQFNMHKINYLGLMVISLLIGMKAGKTNKKISHQITRYAKLIAFTVLSHFQNRLLTSGYYQLERFIKNKINK